MPTVSRVSTAWDPVKDRANQRKHGVSFIEASSVMDDRLRSTELDEQHSENESRFRTVGLSITGRLLRVTAAYDSEGMMRIISARRATKRERHAYENR